MNANTLKLKLKYYRKYITTYLYTLNRKIDRVYILNDNKSAFFFNKKFNTDIFKKIVDPVPEIESLADFSLNKHYNLASNKKVFLHIGSLSDRKGTIEIVKSTEFLKKEIQSEVVILIVGVSTNPLFEVRLHNQIDKSKKNSGAEIIWDNQFVSKEMMKSLFNQCSLVLIPYKNEEASSGILGHSIAAKKKVIVSGGGLLKDIVVENNLGYLLDKVSPRNIAEKIDLTFKINSVEINNKSYLMNHNPINFSKTLLKFNN